MGLTVHYAFRTSTRSKAVARSLIEQLRQRALDLPVRGVGDIVEATGDECGFQQQPRESSLRWLLIQAQEQVRLGDQLVSVMPKAIVAFTIDLGDGCEPANIGLCSYPASVTLADGKVVRTKVSGWRWTSFCKTQYASDPGCGGVENFLRCHLSLVALLDHAKEIGVLGDVSDEGDFFEKRDVKALVQEVGEWNQMIAGFVGQWKDRFGGQVEAAITKFSNFEHLEAKGREGDRQS
jgi:hypothetical protein